MSIYKELNNMKLDFSEIEEIPLSEREQKRILNRFRREINPSKRRNNWLKVSVAAIAVCLLSLFLLIPGTFANIPLVGGLIEQYINSNENFDYSSYKTVIGETSENSFGQLTLNEVMMDDKQLFLSATYEPAKHVAFDYQTTIIPTIKINGVNDNDWVGAQSIELNSEMFTIYNDVIMTEAVETENIQIEIIYDTISSKMTSKAIEQPWTFTVEASQLKLLEEKKEFELNNVITLTSDETVTIQKVISTPISTTVYYDLSQSHREDIYFEIHSADGIIENFSFQYNSNELGDTSFARFSSIDLDVNKYYLVAYDGEGNRLNTYTIPIN